MSSRFHNKYHRHNHHTVPINDPRYPDASHDPIASFSSPFLGPFVLKGPLSAIPFDDSSSVVIQAEGSVNISGSLSLTENLSASNITFTGDVLTTYTTPVTATGQFLIVNVNGINRAIRLWQYE